jgi:hypothetical protein
MKALTKSFLTLALVSALGTSCGGGSNKSGSSSSTSGGINGLPGNNLTQTQSYQSIDQVRSAFNQKALSDGLSSGIEVYHIGPYFNSGYGGGGASFDASFCIDLGFWSAGDCDNYGTPNQEDILLNQLNNGVFKKVSSSSSSSVTYQEPTGIMSNNYGGAEYTYNNSQTKTFDRNSLAYREMLGLDIPAGNIIESKVSPATITMSNGQQVVGQVLEMFIGSSYYGGANITDVKRYVLSTNLPLMANPVAVISGVGYGYNGAQATVSGYLGFLGTTGNSSAIQGVQRIQINQLHIPQGSFNGTIQYNPVQNVTIGY